MVKSRCPEWAYGPSRMISHQHISIFLQYYNWPGEIQVENFGRCDPGRFWEVPGSFRRDSWGGLRPPPTPPHGGMYTYHAIFGFWGLFFRHFWVEFSSFVDRVFVIFVIFVANNLKLYNFARPAGSAGRQGYGRSLELSSKFATICSSAFEGLSHLEPP